MEKPTVKIKQWGIYRRYTGENPWALDGIAIDHPRFPADTTVTTSGILKPLSEELKNLKDGDIVETRNTKYLLVGNNH